MSRSAVRVGVDVGGVLIPKAAIGEDGSLFGEGYLDAPEEPRAFEGVAYLVTRVGAENVFILSKASADTVGRTLAWLEHHRFQDRTGFARDNARFCETRPQKVTLARELALTHVIDDTEQVVRFFCGTGIQPIWFTDDARGFRGKLRDVPRCAGWDDVIRWFAANT